jgi:hypothetical protein
MIFLCNRIREEGKTFIDRDVPAGFKIRLEEKSKVEVYMVFLCNRIREEGKTFIDRDVPARFLFSI